MSEAEKKAKQDELHQKNQDLAKGNSDCKGSCGYTQNNGKWNDSMVNHYMIQVMVENHNRIRRKCEKNYYYSMC